MQAELGTISHGTLRIQDLLPASLDALCTLWNSRYSSLILELDAEYRRSRTPVGIACYEAGYTKGLDLCDDDPWWQTERASELLAAVHDALDEVAPAGAYFGTHEGDGSDFGFWPCPEED